MTYKYFQNKWLGRRVDYDGVARFQCVDLIKQYLNECYGLKPGAWGNAIDYWNRTRPEVLQKFSKVYNSNAKEGDIVVLYGVNGNPYGHIGVATGGLTPESVEILEQNGSTGGGSGTGNDAIRKRFKPRYRVAGLLRPIQNAPAPAPAATGGSWKVGDLVWLHGNVPQWRVYRPGTKPQKGKEVGFIRPANYWHGPNGQKGLTYRIRELTPHLHTVGIDTQTYGRVWIWIGDSDSSKV
jgi:CHAP domain-containing protein